MKKIIISILLAVIAGTAIYGALRNDSSVASFDGRNSSFTIEGAPVILVDGIHAAELASIPGAVITTRYFGNEARGDLNSDGREDVAFLVTQDGGGSGLFYYVVAAFGTDTGYDAADGIFIGDRIAPQTTEIDASAGELRVNYAERRAGEPMTANPSVGVTKRFTMTDGKLTELIP